MIEERTGVVCHRSEGNSENVTQETISLVALCLEWPQEHLLGLESHAHTNVLCMYFHFISSLLSMKILAEVQNLVDLVT